MAFSRPFHVKRNITEKVAHVVTQQRNGFLAPLHHGNFLFRLGLLHFHQSAAVFHFLLFFVLSEIYGTEDQVADT